ncbi:solute carrier family 35 member F2, partial [Tachysurus ichikawai]
MESQEGNRAPDRVGLRALGSWRALVCGQRSLMLKDVFNCHLLKTIVLGQVLSMLICGTAVTSQYLAEARVDTSMLQSFLNYTLLLLTYTTTLSLRRGLSLSPFLTVS